MSNIINNKSKNLAEKCRRYDEFVKKYGTIVNVSFFKYMFKDFDYTMTEQQLLREVNMGHQQRNEYIFNNFDKLNKEVYAFYVLYHFYFDNDRINMLLKQSGMPAEEIKDIQKNCTDLVQNYHYSHYRIINNESGEFDFLRITTNDLLDKEEEPSKRQIEARERIEHLKTFGNLEDLFELESLHDCLFYVKNDTLKSSIIQGAQLASHFKTAGKPKNRNEIDKYLKEVSYEEVKEELDGDCSKKMLARALDLYPEEFDIDKLLLYYATRIMIILETSQWNGISEEAENLNRKYAEILKTLSNEIKTNKSVKLRLAETSSIMYSVQELRRDVKKITESGYYINGKEQHDMEADISEGRIDNLDPEKLKVLHPSEVSVEKIATVDGGYELLRENGLIDRAGVNRLIKKGLLSQEQVSKSVLFGVCEEEVFNKYVDKLETIEKPLFDVLKNDLRKNLYIDGKIDVSFFDTLSEEDKDEMRKKLSVEELTDLYLDENKKEEFKRYKILYRNLFIRDKKDKEKNDEGDKILESLIEKECCEPDDVFDFYESDMLTIKNVSEICDSDIITKKIIDGKIRKDDVKKVCIEDEKFNILYDVLKSSELDWKNKMVLMRMTFANLSDYDMDDAKKQRIEEFQTKCVEILDFEMGNAKSRKKRKKKPNIIDNTTVVPDSEDEEKDDEEDEKKKGNKYVSDPMLRFDLLDKLGDCTWEMLDKGMAIFKYRDLNGGTVVLEKLYNGTEFFYGRATQILSIPVDEFNEIESDLIDKGDIPVDLKLHPKLIGKSTKINHTESWGKSIAEKFGYQTDEKITEEQKSQIDKIIDSIVKSRRVK